MQVTDALQPRNARCTTEARLDRNVCRGILTAGMWYLHGSDWAVNMGRWAPGHLGIGRDKVMG